MQEDGESPRLAEAAAEYEFCQYSASRRRLGIAGTRNLALSRARGVLIQALDQDDLLLPGAFQTLIPRFAEERVHWAIGQADDLMPDGTRRQFPSAISFGLMRAGEVNRWATANGGNWPIHCAALMFRTATWRALGGWTGIPSDDELATFAALSQVADGWYDEALTWLYRFHAKQAHRSAEMRTVSEAGRRIALQRAAAVEAIGLQFLFKAASGPEAAAADVVITANTKDTTMPPRS
jgi:hypothetical protein